jgi:hypothetical protein
LVGCPADLAHQATIIKTAQQETAALMRIGFPSVGVDLFELGIGYLHVISTEVPEGHKGEIPIALRLPKIWWAKTLSR